MLLFFVRHGDPIYVPDSLTPLGRRQAEAVAKRLARYGLDQIYVSSSARAIQTSEPTCEILKMQSTILDWCNESHAWSELAFSANGGEYRWVFQQEDYRKLLISPEIYALGENWYDHPAFEGTKVKEGTLRIRRETDAFMKNLGYVHNRERKVYVSEQENDSRVALFAHQGFGLAFLSALLDIPYPLFSTRFDMGHTGMTVIEFSPAAGECVPQILQLANDSHLYAEGLPTDYQNRLRF